MRYVVLRCENASLQNPAPEMEFSWVESSSKKGVLRQKGLPDSFTLVLDEAEAEKLRKVLEVD